MSRLKPTCPMLTALMVAVLLIGVGCQEASKGQKWPGPCQAVWTINEVVEFGPWRFVVPISVGEDRVMTFTYNEDDLLTLIEDDYDNDGVLEHRIGLMYDDRGRIWRESFDRGADGVIEEERTFEYEGYSVHIGRVRLGEGTVDVTTEMYDSTPAQTRIWDSCHGQCLYDDFGNLLEDRDAASLDILRFDYGCWATPEGA